MHMNHEKCSFYVYGTCECGLKIFLFTIIKKVETFSGPKNLKNNKHSEIYTYLIIIRVFKSIIKKGEITAVNLF